MCNVQCAMCKPVVEQWKGEVMTQCDGAAGWGWWGRVMIEHGRGWTMVARRL